jgi:hypothetical protein
MKQIILIACLLPALAFGQSKADAERVMSRFKRFYNAGQKDSLYYMFSAGDRKAISKERNANDMQWYFDNFGAMISYSYLGIDNEDADHVTVFKTKWTKGGDKTSSFSLDKENKFLTFRLGTSSPGIDKLLAAEKKGK